ncbi:MAG: bifunctional chorismate mutase/prephenate dehydratase [Clostridiales bacterium]|nr:bifunctional chorismate mutase/prephenate dehydratase [Clostridiales bacterium]
MDMTNLREEINKIDEELVKLFSKRMNVAREIAHYKQENNLPVYDPERERQVLVRQASRVEPDLQMPVRLLYNTLFDISRNYQRQYVGDASGFRDVLKNAMANTPATFPKQAKVACQGIEGAYSQQACDRLFSLPDIMYFRNFEGVFQAIESGFCQYGVLPIENSANGSVTQVYDLMRSHRFHIVRSIKMKVDHRLLANPGVKLSDIKEVVSHQQALGQCSLFLKKLPNVKITMCENTAVAAKMVHESGRKDIAAISSRGCDELYGLDVVEENIANSDSNFTRFICIARDMEIYPGSNRTSLMLQLPHKPGSLYNQIAGFAAHGLNLTKLESRPIPGTDFEFQFYFDLEADPADEDVAKLLSDIITKQEGYTYLGSYQEI